MPALTPALRKALQQLPQKEKDQLLVRLVAQDVVLMEQLTFRLLEGPDALEQRRATLRAQVDDPVRGYHQTPNDLLVILRQLQARLAYHAKITDDSFGEIELSLRLLANVFQHQGAVTARLHGPNPAPAAAPHQAHPRSPPASRQTAQRLLPRAGRNRQRRTNRPLAIRRCPPGPRSRTPSGGELVK
jgi:hypothetical protein